MKGPPEGLAQRGELDATVRLASVDLVLGVTLVVGELQLTFTESHRAELVGNSTVA